MHIKRVLQFFIISLFFTGSIFASIVGTTKANMSISQGNVNLSLVLQNQKAVASLAPSLAITYNSSNISNKLLGVGFNLSGMSSISICNENTKEEIQDDKRAYNYCLNGQKLFLVNSSDTYGSNEVEYKTQINNYSKIISYASDLKTTSFKVFTKEGLIHEYGFTTNSKKQNSLNEVKVFKRNKTSDRFNNSIEYIYNTNNFIQEIQYSNNKFIFEYEEKEKKTFKYFKGVKSTYESKLKTIISKTLNEEISRYTFTYKNSSNKNYLEKITQCYGSKCLKPLEFSWEEKNEENLFSQSELTTNKNFGLKDDTYGTLSGNYNQDSFTDIIRYKNKEIYTVFFKKDKSLEEVLYTSSVDFGSKTATYGILNADINADGLSDIVRYTNNKIYTLLAKGDGEFEEKVFTSSKNFSTKDDSYYALSADINADGRADIIRYTNNEIYTFISQGNGEYEEVLFNTSKNFGSKMDTYFTAQGDYNADGLGDFIRYTNNEIYTFFSKGNGTYEEVKFTTSTNFKARNDTYYSASSDMNSDGITDLLRYTNNKIYTLFAKGNGEFEEVLYTASKNFSTLNSSYAFSLADRNNDGVKDIIRYTNSEIYVLFSKNNGEFEEKAYTSSSNFGSKNDTYETISGDFDSSSSSDIIRYTNNKLHLISFDLKKDYITRVTNNSDQDLKFTFSSLNNEELYNSNSSSTYPNLDIKSSSRQVLQSFMKVNSLGTYNNYSYTYENYKTNFERGSLGFEKITKQDEESSLKTISTYEQSFPFIFLLSKKQSYINEAMILEEENFYEQVSYTNINAKIKDIYKKEKLSKKYDLDGTFLLKVKEENSKPDIYGNISNIKTSTFSQENQEDTSKAYIQEINQSFKQADTNLFITNLLSTKKVTSRKANDEDSSISNEVSYEYTSKGLLKSETIYSEDKSLSKAYEYDSFSNLVKQSIKSEDFDTRVELYTYDGQGLNLLEVKNALNQKTTNVYDSKNNLVKNTDINSLETTFSYDELNRKIKQINPDGTEKTWEYTWDNSFENSLYKISIKSTGSPEVSTFFNLNNQKTRVQRVGFKGSKIYEDTYYDELGRVIKKGTPHLEENIAYFAYNTYDALNRIKSIQRTGANDEVVKKTFSYNAFDTIETNAKNQKKLTRKNIIGEVVYVQDNIEANKENEKSEISYTYDVLGNLSKTVDSKNNEIIIKYNNLGQKIYMNDPDLGIWRYEYNLLGELLSQSDAKNQTTKMKYDVLGRLIKKTAPEGITTFTYDVATNGKGKLAIEKMQDYKKEYFYDNLSRVKEIKEYINNKVFSTSYVYNEEGKLLSTISPNGFISTNEYNEQGYLSAIKSPINIDVNFTQDSLKNSIKKYFDLKTSSFNSLISLNTQVEQYRTKSLEFLKLSKQYKGLNQELEEQLSNTTNLLIKTSLSLNEEAKEHEAKYTSASKELNYYLIKLINYNDELLYKWLMETFSTQTDTLINSALEKLTKAKETLDTITTQDELTQYKELIQYYIEETRTIAQEAKTNLELARNYKQKYKNLNEGIDDSYKGMFDNSEQKYYYKILDADEFGRITKSFTGNGLITLKDYNKKNGHLNSITTGYNGNNDIRDISYTYDVLNNVTSKSDYKQNITHSYTFDNLNRLSTSETIKEDETSLISYEYDSIGNITLKSDVSSENYVYLKAHQLQSVGNLSYTYDANGNTIKKTKNSQTINIEYNSYNKPILIEDETNKTQFFYAPNQSRYKKILNGNSTFYIGKHYEFENITGATLEKNYIYAGNELVAIHIEEDDGKMVLPQNRYLHKDALGSIDTITNESGVVIQRLAYSAFGEKLVQTWINEVDKNKALVKRGYTSHEHIEEFGFIHMNGRVYDSETGRFLSADPNVFHPFDTQNFNRYSYVMNNPLKYTDPSGFDIFSQDDYENGYHLDDPHESGKSHVNNNSSTNSYSQSEKNRITAERVKAAVVAAKKIENEKAREKLIQEHRRATQLAKAGLIDGAQNLWDDAKKVYGELVEGFTTSDWEEIGWRTVEIVNKTSGTVSFAAMSLGLVQVAIVSGTINVLTDGILSAGGKKGTIEIGLNGFIDISSSRAGPFGQIVGEVAKTVNGELLNGK